ncbi:MAG: hypothetical protein HQ556_06720 [Candidatus Marinimicrobia bacterium]|nr:hypothetical protein [Candidatus Neomarinimicrobiota bacterium]
MNEINGMNPPISGSESFDFFKILLMPWKRSLVPGIHGLNALGVEEVQKKDILAHYDTKMD